MVLQSNLATKLHAVLFDDSAEMSEVSRGFAGGIHRSRRTLRVVRPMRLARRTACRRNHSSS